MEVLLANKLVLIVLGSLALLGMLLIYIVSSSDRPCLEGGIMGKRCNCVGYKLQTNRTDIGTADGMTVYKCVGISY